MNLAAFAMGALRGSGGPLRGRDRADAANPALGPYGDGPSPVTRDKPGAGTRHLQSGHPSASPDPLSGVTLAVESNRRFLPALGQE